MSVRLSAWNNSNPTGQKFMKFDIRVKVKVKVTLEQATKAQRGIRGIALVFS
jgi:hypothetical protein